MRAFRYSGKKKKKNRLFGKKNDYDEQHPQEQDQSQSQSPLQTESNARHQSPLEGASIVSSSSSHNNKSATSTRTPTSLEESAMHQHQHDNELLTSQTTTTTGNKADDIANMVRQQADISHFFRQATFRMTAVLNETLQQQQQASSLTSNDSNTLLLQQKQQQQQQIAAKAQQVCHTIDLLANKHQQLAENVAQIALEGLEDNSSHVLGAAAAATTTIVPNNSDNNSSSDNTPSTLQTQKISNDTACISNDNDNNNNDDNDDEYFAAVMTLPRNTPGSFAPWDENSTAVAEAAKAAPEVVEGNANIMRAVKLDHHQTSIENVADDDDDASLTCILGDLDENKLGNNASVGGVYSNMDDDDDDGNGIDNDNEHSSSTNQLDYLQNYCGTGDVTTAALEQIPSEISLPEAFIDLFALLQSANDDKDGDNSSNNNNTIDHEKAVQYAMEQLRQQNRSSGNSDGNNVNKNNGNGRIRLLL